MRRFRYKLCIVAVMATALLFAPSALALSNSPDAGVWQTQGPVRGMAQLGSTVYLGGTFTAIKSSASSSATSYPRQNLAAVDADTGAAVPTWSPMADGAVYAVALGADGYLYIGGSFQNITVDGVTTPAQRLAKLDPATGAVLPFAASATNTVRRIVPTATGLYVGGDFASVNGQTRKRIAKLDYAGNLDPTFHPSFDGTVYAIQFTLDGTKLYVGGRFTTANGVARIRSARLDPTTGALDSWQAAVGTQPDGTLWDHYVVDIAQNANTGQVVMAYSGLHNLVDSYDSGTGRRQWRLWVNGDPKVMVIWNDRLIFGGHFRREHFDGSSVYYYHDYIMSTAWTGVPYSDWNPYVHPEDIGATREEGFLSFLPVGSGPGSRLWFGGNVQKVSGADVNYFGRFTW